MELLKEILAHALADEETHITFPNLQIDAARIVELECYKALKQIKAILEDGGLSDETCFAKIEEIICTFEALGSTTGTRHDFG